MPAVSVKGVSKKYRFYRSGRDRLKETLSFGRKRYGRDFWALRDINLDVEPGTTPQHNRWHSTAHERYGRG
jgi:ABC-type polysaccharide/polyol phosphate transport system ATPase subunit